ncbi:probable glycosyltransferase At3g07620 isoform X2 [Corylus avellana]|uniref:probable glycosyltransferase At3g07620 isoform X2 n=1 Tax=Corylus avellana TaxID=13451 RepID=UPI00286C0F33|nr:probable glycosyltransferase At3g07620 isoform X2 [Corylus avellana]
MNASSVFSMLVSPEQEERTHRRPKHPSSRPHALHLRLLLLAVLMAALMVAIASFFRGSAHINTLKFDIDSSENSSKFLVKGKPAPPQFPFPSSFSSADAAPPPSITKTIANKSHSKSSPFSPIFLPHPDPFHTGLGNYFSEHMFKVALLRSSLITRHPEEAHLFFLPFSINLLRNDPRVYSEASISEFVTQYTTRVRRDFKFWNASAGADHFYVYCHSVGREAASKLHDLYNNAIQVTCSSSYFQRYYVSHKDVGLPQVWPRPHEKALTPPDARHKLVYFSGRIQNSRIRQELIALWGNDSYVDVFSGSPPFSYEEGFRRSKYCLHVKGYEVNTARVSDAIHYGCIPVIISNYYELPFANVLDWSKFSVIINQREIALTKNKLLSITTPKYLNMFRNLCQVRKHFCWNKTPRGFDSFHMTAYQLWLRRNINRPFR